MNQPASDGPRPAYEDDFTTTVDGAAAHAANIAHAAGFPRDPWARSGPPPAPPVYYEDDGSLRLDLPGFSFDPYATYSPPRHHRECGRVDGICGLCEERISAAEDAANGWW